MPLGKSLKTMGKMIWSSSERSASLPPSRALTITCRGNPISREDFFKYTNGRFLANETKICNRRYITFDVDQLCAVAASVGGQQSPIHTIEKMEGGFSKALLLRKEDGSEIVAKIPFAIAGPPKYNTASEVAVLRYLHMHTQVPVPKVLAWNADPSNPVGAEYIMMEKAIGVQLYKLWGEMSPWDQFCFVKELVRLESGMTRIRFPAIGSLYLRESMTGEDAFIPLDREMDPTEEFCIGPSCDQGWYPSSTSPSIHTQFNRGPWQSLSTFGIALIDRETALLEQKSRNPDYNPPRGTLDEQFAVLKMARKVMSKFPDPNLLLKLSFPVLWHTDLHMGNIYVPESDPTKITSFIDWQSIAVSPLFLQARFPIFLPIDETYPFSTSKLPQLPQDYEEMDADDKIYAEHKFLEAKLAKVYELANGTRNVKAYNALQVPPFLREFFVRCGEVAKEGEIPLRACLIEICNAWNELGFTEKCPISFSEDGMKTHEHEFQKYRDFHSVHELARDLLNTDFDGWINPHLEFATYQQKNEQLFQEVVRRSNEYNMSPEDIRRIWPYLER